jgi:hypothetical protein
MMRFKKQVLIASTAILTSCPAYADIVCFPDSMFDRVYSAPEYVAAAEGIARSYRQHYAPQGKITDYEVLINSAL